MAHSVIFKPENSALVRSQGPEDSMPDSGKFKDLYPKFSPYLPLSGPPGGGWAPAPTGGGPAGPAGPTPQAAGRPAPPEAGGPERPLQRRRSPARPGGAASGPVPVGGAEECASRSPSGPGTWDLAPRAMGGKGRRCGARTGGDGLARRASSSSGSGASRVGPQLPRPRRFHAPMPGLWRDTVSRRPGESCINAGSNTSPGPALCVSAVQMGGWTLSTGAPGRLAPG